jgi:hypothetical protein
MILSNRCLSETNWFDGRFTRGRVSNRRNVALMSDSVSEKKVGMVDGFDDCDLLDLRSPKSGSKR